MLKARKKYDFMDNIGSKSWRKERTKTLEGSQEHGGEGHHYHEVKTEAKGYMKCKQQGKNVRSCAHNNVKGKILL